MSISAALNNAMTGLTVSGRIAENVSTNIANAMTQGYARREVELSQQVLGNQGAGVTVAGIIRHVDPVLLANRRLAEADVGQASINSGFLQTIESAIGLPDNETSLTGRMSKFDSALIEAASRPDSTARLQAVVDSAASVATQLNNISDTVQSQRMQADQDIGAAVDFINTSLQQIAELNARISGISGSANTSSSLLDQRQKMIDGISEYIPVREIPRDRGMVALYSPGGAILLDGNPVELGFTSVPMITPDMVVGGALSGLTINGKSVSSSAEQGPIAGGRLAALFNVRDVQAPEVQTKIDAVARDLIERFQDSAVDPTLSSGAPGFFTDRGSAFSAADELGLAGQISVNALVDPNQGGALWRVRDGLGATSPGATGDATLLNALSDAFGATRTPATGGFIVARSATGIASDLLSDVSVSLGSAEFKEAYARAQSETLIGMELENGVDTDAEMQMLLMVEQAFAANAKVISAMDQLLQSLLSI